MGERDPRELQSRLLDSTIEGVVVYDAQGVVRYANKQARVLTGQPDLEGKSGADFIHPEDLPRAYEGFLALATTPGATADVTQRVVRADGDVVWIDARLTNLLDDPEVRGVVSNFIDASQRRDVEDQLRHSQRLEMVGQAAGFVAHDLSNFLVVVSGNADLLRLSNPSAEARRSLEHISVASERASQLTRRLLTFSQRTPVRFRGIDLSLLLQELTRDLFRVVPVDLTLSLPPEDARRPVVYGDVTHLEQIVLNLVLNAREAVADRRDGAIEIAVTLGQRSGLRSPGGSELDDGVYVRLSVIDNGQGIPEESIDVVFRPYFSTRSERSSGMGLTIVSRLVEESEGAISIESAVGEGTCVSVDLPLYLGEFEPTSEGHEAHALPYGHETLAIAEDDPDVLDFMVRSLRHLGYAVAVAGNCATTMESLAGDLPLDLLIVDVGALCERSGLLAQVREHRPDLRVLAVSGSEPPFEAESHDDATTLSKPFGIKRLADAVRRAIERPMPRGRPAGRRGDG